MTGPNSEWRTLGNTTRAAFRGALRRSWQSGDSPMTAAADAVYDTLWPLQMTRLGAAMAWVESKNASWSCETAPAGQPCIPRDRHNAWAMKAPSGTWARFADYAEAAAAWQARILDPAGPYGRAGTVDELIRIYHPVGPDGNTEATTRRYVETVCQEVDALPPIEEEPMPPSVNPFRPPQLYTLSKDYARYGLTRAQAEKIASHRFARQGQRIEAIFLHIMEGTVAGSLSWWASGKADASSSVMVGRDGSLLRVIEGDVHFAPWTNGDVQSPSARGRALLDRIGWANPNLASVTLEAEGYSGDDPTPEMVETICWMVTEWMSRHLLDLDDVYKHADINSVTRANCPGRYWDVVMRRLRDGGRPPAEEWPGRPQWLPPDLIPILFPEADPAGARTAAWLRHCAETGMAPARKAIVWKGEPRELIVFEGGLAIGLDGRRLSDG